MKCQPFALISLIFPLYLISCRPVDEQVSGNEPPQEHRVASLEVTPETEALAAAIDRPRRTVPRHWRSQPLYGLMKDHFMISGYESTPRVMVQVYPGDAGQWQESVDRWRQEAGRSPLGQGQHASASQAVSIGGKSGFQTFVEGVGHDGQPLVIRGVVLPGEAETWLIEMKGAPEAVEAEQESFQQFLQSIRFGDAETERAAPQRAPNGY